MQKKGGKNNYIKLYPQKIVKISHFKLDQETKTKNKQLKHKSKKMNYIPYVELFMLYLCCVCLSPLSAQEIDKPDPLNYLDEHGKTHKITNVQEEFYYNRIHTAKLEGSTEATVYWVNLYVG